MKTEGRNRGSLTQGGGNESSKELVFSGLGVSVGVVIGPAHVMERGLIDVPDYYVSDISAELKRFRAAVKQSIEQVQKLRTKASTLSEAAAEELKYLLDAHKQMLSGSRLVRGVEDRIKSEKLNAEAQMSASADLLISPSTKGYINSVANSG